MCESKEYPIGIQNFEKIIRNNFLYVDKTEYVYRLVKKSGYYFLSRPRRFGKSLLLSTLEAFFLGKRDLFAGFAIERHDDVVWNVHPVLHLDLNSQDYTKDEESLSQVLDKNLKKWEKLYDVNYDKDSYSLRFERIIEAAFHKTGRQVVILIDEYDKPLMQNISKDRIDRQNRFRETLKGFYGVLKTSDAFIRFAMLTGVTKFGKVSVFSDLNNPRDLSLEPEYNAICGITESELLSNMRDGIQLLADKLHMGFDETCLELKRNYDGYRFSEEKSEGIYNPFSLLNVMESRRFADYWFMTATPTMLIELIRDRNIDLSGLEGSLRTESELQGIDPMFEDPIPLLFQSGYLTIKGARREGRKTVYRLGFPNDEVSDGFMEALFPFYVNQNEGSDGTRLISQCVSYLEMGNVDGFMTILKSLLAGVPYSESGERVHEGRFRDVMYILCRLMGMSVNCEVHTSLGRIDMTVETDKFIYVMEFKVDQSPEKAIAQIVEKHYADRFLTDNRSIVRVGVEYSSKERNIVAWTTE